MCPGPALGCRVSAAPTRLIACEEVGLPAASNVGAVPRGWGLLLLLLVLEGPCC